MQFGAPLQRQCRRCLGAVVDGPLPVPSSKFPLWLLILQSKTAIFQPEAASISICPLFREPEPTEHPGPGTRGSILQLCRMAPHGMIKCS